MLFGVDCPGIVNGIGDTVQVIPAVTAGAYTAGNVIGGVMTFANLLNENGTGIIESISLSFKGSAPTTEFDVALFSAKPNGTYTDKSAPTWAAADGAILLGIYPLTVANSQLGTMAIYNLDNCGKMIAQAPTTVKNAVGAGSTNGTIWAVVTTKAIVTPASTSDMALTITAVW